MAHPQSRGCATADYRKKGWLLQKFARGLLARDATEFGRIGARPELEVLGKDGWSRAAVIVHIPVRRRRGRGCSRLGWRGRLSRCDRLRRAVERGGSGHRRGCRRGRRRRSAPHGRLVYLAEGARPLELVEAGGGLRLRGSRAAVCGIRVGGGYRRLVFHPGVASFLNGDGLWRGRNLLRPSVVVPPAELGQAERIRIPSGWCAKLVILRHDGRPPRVFG